MVFYRDIYRESPSGRYYHGETDETHYRKQKWWVNGFFVGSKIGTRMGDALEYQNGERTS